MSKEFKYKTKEVNGKHMMICSNSNPEHGKYGRFAPEGGCENWVATGKDVTQVLCWQCVQRSLSNSPIEKIED